MRKVRISLVAVLFSCLALAQALDKDKIWREFVDWAKTQPGVWAPLENYRPKLLEAGLTPAQADERIALIPKLFEDPARRQEISTLGFNSLYRAPQQTRFTTEPNAFLVSTVKDMKPGKALDVAMGQGRNAVFLATKGWDVTGFDLAEDGMKVANDNAAKAGTKITTIKANFDNFDYGKERWDLIYFIYTDVPHVDAKYVAQVIAALKPGGLVLIDRPFRSITDPEPNWQVKEHDKVNAIVKAWSDLQIVSYTDTDEFAEWQQGREGRLEHKRRIVRLLARKL